MSKSMPHLRKKSKKNTVNALPLFASWHAEAGLTPAARRLVRRFGLLPSTAALIAQLAGMNTKGRANG